MEVIGKIAIKRNKKERVKKTWLTIGLITLTITMICEVLLGNFAFLALIVSFLYLFNLRSKMGKKVLYKDVVIRVDNNGIEKKIEISNCEYLNKILCSVRFIIDNEEIIIDYSKQKERIYIGCIAKKELFLGNTTVTIFDKERYSIQLFVTLDDANVISKELKCPLNIPR